MKRYAFIDVQNTEGTANKFCGFSVDWAKLCNYLRNEHKCEKVFLYTGIEIGDETTAKEFEALSELDYVVARTKPIIVFKRKEKRVSIKCIKCGEENVAAVDMGYDRKANCDVELTVDVLEKAGPDAEMMIFTGDGDFEFLARKVMDRVSKIYFASNKTHYNIAGIPQSRFSTKLSKLLKEKPEKVLFIDLKTWKFKVKRDI